MEERKLSGEYQSTTSVCFGRVSLQAHSPSKSLRACCLRSAGMHPHCWASVEPAQQAAQSGGIDTTPAAANQQLVITPALSARQQGGKAVPVFTLPAPSSEALPDDPRPLPNLLSARKQSPLLGSCLAPRILQHHHPLWPVQQLMMRKLCSLLPAFLRTRMKRICLKKLKKSLGRWM